MIKSCCGIRVAAVNRRKRTPGRPRSITMRTPTWKLTADNADRRSRRSRRLSLPMQIRIRIVTYPPCAARTRNISTGGRDNVGMCGGYWHCALIEPTASHSFDLGRVFRSRQRRGWVWNESYFAGVNIVTRSVWAGPGARGLLIERRICGHVENVLLR